MKKNIGYLRYYHQHVFHFVKSANMNPNSDILGIWKDSIIIFSFSVDVLIFF
jgi:hypothetical protein